MNAFSSLDGETRALLQEGISRFNRDHRASPAWPQRLGGNRDDVRAMWACIGRNGWPALGLPEVVGGSGLAIGDLLPLMRASGEGLWPAPLIECLGLACGALLALPSGADRDRLLQNIAGGEIIVGMAGSMGGSGLSAVRADVGSAEIRLTGNTPLAVGGGAWDTILVPVVTDTSEGFGLAVIEKAASGLTCTDVETVDGRHATIFSFADASGRLLATGVAAIAAARQRGSLLAAAEAAGLARAALDATVAYLGLRRQFGQSVLQFQAIQHRLVEMHIRVCELNAMLEMAARAYDLREPHLPRLLLQLRAQGSKTAAWVTQQAIQLHGGMGMTRDLPIGAYYRRALFIDSMFGSYEDAIDRLSAMSNAPNQEISREARF